MSNSYWGNARTRTKAIFTFNYVKKSDFKLGISRGTYTNENNIRIKNYVMKCQSMVSYIKEGLNRNIDTIPFHPYFSIKDTVGFIILI